MKGSQLARAIANIVDQRRDLDGALQEHLAKWVKSTLMKGASLDLLRKMRIAGGHDFAEWHLKVQPEAELRKLAKKLDPHLPNLKTCGETALRSHLIALIADRVQPTQQPEPPPRGANKKSIEEIFRLPDKSQRGAELKKLSPAELKTAIKKHEMGMSGLSSRPSKTELIEYIQASIGSGWHRTALDESKY